MFRTIRKKKNEININAAKSILEHSRRGISVVVFGRCHLVEAGEKATTQLKQFAMKYYPKEQMVDEEIAQAGKAVQMFEIEIEHMSEKEVQER